MGRFDKNLNVTSKNIPFFPSLFERESGLSKGRERGYGRVGSTKGARGRRKGDAPLLPSPSRAVSRLNSIPFPFGSRHAGQRQSSYPIIIFIFPDNCYKFYKVRFLSSKFLSDFNNGFASKCLATNSESCNN